MPRRRGVDRIRTLAVAFGALVVGPACLLGLVGPAGAQDDGGDDGTETASVFDVVEVSGFLDEVVADFVEGTIEDAAADGSGGVILQVNSTRAVVSDERLVELAELIDESPVPVYAWIGPSGARAEGGVAQLVAVTERFALTPGSRLGDTGEQILPVERFGVLFGDAAAALETSTIGDEEAVELGLQERRYPVLGDFVLDLPGFGFEVDEAGDRVPTTAVRFNKLPLVDQLMHTVASPAVAYLLVLIGGALLVFELYTAGIGVAGVVGAGSFVLGSYGLAALPTNGWAVALLVVAVLGYAVDVQTGVARTWSVIATVCLLVGSWFLYDGERLSWITLLAGVGGMVLAMVAGMPAMVRTRFGTPTIGREWMLGEVGIAVEQVAPDGVVAIRDAPWRARTNRATPIEQGDRVRVVAIDGLVLEVEPLDGAARDYRDRSGG